MHYTPLTPFRRAQSAAVPAESPITPAQCDSLPPCDKWQAVKLVARLRKILGLNDRDLAVLEALVSFHPAKMLDLSGPLVVHPANATLSDRLNGMPASTLRRHLARLVGAGLIIRRDSPNGKRFVRRTAAGKMAYGFDLSPLVRNQAQLEDMAAEVLAAEASRKALREAVVLMRRDLLALDPDAPLLEESGRLLRRNLSLDALHALVEKLQTALQTEDMSANDSQNERHQQNENQITFESDSAPVLETPSLSETAHDGNRAEKQVSLSLVLKACPGLATWLSTPIRSWQDLERAADHLHPMMRIDTSLWHEAKARFGARQAAVVLVAMLERVEKIRSPGAYLRHLTAQMRAGLFSPLPMLKALMLQPSSQM